MLSGVYAGVMFFFVFFGGSIASVGSPVWSMRIWVSFGLSICKLGTPA